MFRLNDPKKCYIVQPSS